MTGKALWVTACIPTFRCTAYLRSAVISLLSQSHPFIRVVVINDGDPEPPWPALADIEDPRLIRFDLRENNGPYFALDIALKATPDPLFLIQDADDWSVPHRVATLIEMLRNDHSNYAFSAIQQFSDSGRGTVILDRPLCSRRPDTVPTVEFRSLIFNHGLFQVSALKRLGGYFGGFRLSYDMLLTNLLLLVGSVSWTPEFLYWRRLRAASLTRSPETGLRSKARRQVHAQIAQLYWLAYQDYQYFVQRRISGQQLLQRIRERVKSSRGAFDDQRINAYAAHLRLAIHYQAVPFQNH